MWWLLATVVLLWGLSWLGKRLLERAPTGDESNESTQAPPPPEDLEYDLRIGDELDLHGIHPRDVSALVDAFVDDAYERGRPQVRIVHGKGIGAVRSQVRSRLAAHPHVLSFGDAPPPSSWGATVVELQGAGRDVEAGDASD